MYYIPSPNDSMQRTALRAAAEPERWAAQKALPLSLIG
jgi:hypothetical protein